MHKRGKVLAILLALVVFFTTVPVSAFAQEATVSGTGDKGTLWELKSGEAPETLVISITGFDKLEKKDRTKKVAKGTSLENLGLPKELVAYTDEPNEYGTGSGKITIENVTWKANPTYDSNALDRYVFRPEFKLPDGYQLGKNVKLPTIEVYVSEFRDVRWEHHGTHYAHYIKSFNYDEEMFLYGMNYNLNYAHPSPVWGNRLPKYTTGYLTVDDFRTSAEYFEFIERAAKLLYAGYPNNGANLYEIVEDENHQATVEDFNKMLVPPAELAEVFPELKHYTFEYPLSAKETEVIITFVNKVLQGKFDNSVNGLDKASIMNMPFYKASTCFTLDSGSSPFEVFKAWVSNDFYMTKQVAYLSTQHAFSTLLNEYGIPDNNLDHEAKTSLPKALLEFSKKGEIITEAPRVNAIGLTGELHFSFNPKDNLWYSEPIMIHEPEDYNGLYKLDLPKGIRTMHNINHVYADEQYRLVSDHEVGADEVIAVEATMPWLKVFEQFSPEDMQGINGKNFEGMAGAIVKRTPLRIVFPHTTQAMGKLSVSATTVGDELANKAFKCRLELKNHKLNGIYGDVEFVDGVAEFSLKNGESKVVSYLPEGAEYVLTSETGRDFTTESTDPEGVIKKNENSIASFKYTFLPDISVSKVVTGEGGDLNREFNFDISLKTADGKAIDGEFEYVGTVISEMEDKVSAPESGTLTVKDSKGTIKLSHGQRIVIKNLPYKAQFAVCEIEANKDGYTTTYNTNKAHDKVNGALGEDANITVENHKGAGGTSDEDENPPIGDDSKPEAPDNPNQQNPDQQENTDANQGGSEADGAQKDDGAKTGDNMNLALWGGLLGLSIVGLLALLIANKRKNKK